MNNNVNISSTERIKWIDTIKVLTMLLVIIGHSAFLTLKTKYGGINYVAEGASLSIGSRITQYIEDFIYMFHMPLFMAVSGMLFSTTIKKGKTCASIIKSKAYRLLIPFMVVTLFYDVPIFYLTGYYNNSNNIIKDVIYGQLFLLGNSHLWYIMSLFTIILLSLIIEKLELRKKTIIFWGVLLFLFGVSSVLTYIVSPLLGGINLNFLYILTSLRYLLYFYIGFTSLELLKKYNIKKPIGVVACLGGLGILATTSFLLTDKITPPWRLY